MEKIILGREGEDLAVEFLLGRGFVILERNYRSGHTEIDVIAKNEQEIIFVEVKTRTDDTWSLPEASVTFQKQRNIIKTAHAYILRKQIALQARFDIISIIKNAQVCSINHLPYAFYPRMRK